MQQVFLAAILHHLPSSAAHIQLNATAAWVEGVHQTQHKQPRLQEFHFPLQAGYLCSL